MVSLVVRQGESEKMSALPSSLCNKILGEAVNLLTAFKGIAPALV
jgi:hypothetical protein